MLWRIPAAASIALMTACAVVPERASANNSSTPCDASYRGICATSTASPNPVTPGQTVQLGSTIYDNTDSPRCIYRDYRVTDAHGHTAFDDVFPTTIYPYVGASVTSIAWSTPRNLAPGTYSYTLDLSDCLFQGSYLDPPPISIVVAAPTYTGGGGTATPELPSGELVVAGLLPCLGLMLYRRRTAREKALGRPPDETG